MVDLVNLEQLDAAKLKFTELGEAISHMSSENTRSMESLIASMREGFKSVTEEISQDPRLAKGARYTGVSEQYVSSMAGKFNSMSQSLGSSFESLERTLTGAERSFGGLADDARAAVSGAGEPDGEGVDAEGPPEGGAGGGPAKKGGKPKKGPVGRIVQSEVRNLKGRLSGMLSKLKLPSKLGTALAGGLGLITYGYMDKDRVRAEAGELKNILIAAYDDGVKGSLSRGTSALSGMQEAFQRYKGIQREEIQNTAQALVDGGFSVDQMLRKVDGDLRDVQASALSTTLALDKMFELPGGESAKRMASMMALYGKNSDEARQSLMRLYMLGRDSGIGAMQYVKNVEEASGELVQMGFDIDNVTDIYDFAYEQFKKMGVEKQFAGRQAALGVQQIASGIGRMSDQWMVVLGERMGHGRGWDARQKMMDAFSRVLQDRNVNELNKIILTVWDIALKASGDQEEAAKIYVEKVVGWGYEGARVVATVGKMAKEGKMVEAAQATKENFEVLKNAFETEKEKASQFELMMNTWMKGMATLGQALLGYAIQFVAWLIAYFKALPQFFQNLKSLDFDANIRLAMDLNNAFFNMGAHKDRLDASLEQLTNAAGDMFSDVLGASMRSLQSAWNFDPTGQRPATPQAPAGPAGGTAAPSGGPLLGAYSGGGGAPAPRVITIPVPTAGTPQSQTIQVTPAPPPSVGGISTDLWAGGGVTLSIEGPDPLGDMTIKVGGNCPRCGYRFDEAGPTSEATAGSTPSLGAYGEGAPGTVSLVEKGRIGGRFRKQSLRPGAKEGQAHTGIDVDAPAGTPVYAAAEGVVTHTGVGKGIGANITIQHPESAGGVTSWYGHMGEMLVKEGERVKPGQLIGTVGTSTGTAKATSPHLHFEVLKPGRKHERPAASATYFDERMDPEAWLSQVGAYTTGGSSGKKKG